MPLRKALYGIESSTASTTICVTGATGYIAGPIIQRLLAAGHTVRATCRDPNADAKLKHLKGFNGAQERLQLFKVDLETEGGYDEVLQGCQYLIHTAAVVRMTAPKGKERSFIIDPSVKGVRNVLGSVNRCSSVERVVLTSSVAAVVGDQAERGKGYVYTEDDWNTTCTDLNLTYHQAKKLSEKTAHEMHEAQSRWSLVVINPCLVCGPPLGNMKCESVGFMRKLLGGSYMGLLPSVAYCVVDVDDVAAAHTLAMVTKEAKGRYLITNQTFYLSQYVELLKRKWGMYNLPWFPTPYFVFWILSMTIMDKLDMILLKAIWGKPPHFDNSKSIKDLGMTYIDIETSQNDMVEAMIKLGILKDRRPKSAANEINMTHVRKRE